ncbi:MAG: hypothetical protein LC114_21055 [Bryobacterales bacterium]|nr:hypothetical protein [Bryobacterales bacterium]
MSHAPDTRRNRASDEPGAPRSSGGLASNFATAVVRFFDHQDPREIGPDTPHSEPLFDAEMVEYLPLPKLERKEMARVLPEVFADLSLTPRNLFRSDVDLDGDNDLDLALLVRLSKTEALGAVVEYLGDKKFRFAGKFRCRYDRPEDFPKCFTIVQTGAGTMHILSRTSDLTAAEHPGAGAAGSSIADPLPPEHRVSGWRWMRLEHGELVRYGEFEEPLCVGPRGEKRKPRASSDAEPAPRTTADVVRIVSPCPGAPACAAYRYDAERKRVAAVHEGSAEFCTP